MRLGSGLFATRPVSIRSDCPATYFIQPVNLFLRLVFLSKSIKIGDNLLLALVFTLINPILLTALLIKAKFRMRHEYYYPADPFRIDHACLPWKKCNFPGRIVNRSLKVNRQHFKSVPLCLKTTAYYLHTFCALSPKISCCPAQVLFHFSIESRKRHW